jgi:hypothetical protein
MAKSRLGKLLEAMGSAAAKPVATSDVKPAEHTPDISNKDVKAALEVSSSEEINAPVIESFSDWSSKRRLAK